MWVNVQFQRKDGTWTTSMVVQNISSDIINAMKSVERANGGARVRTVSQSGSVIDIL